MLKYVSYDRQNGKNVMYNGAIAFSATAGCVLGVHAVSLDYSK